MNVVYGGFIEGVNTPYVVIDTGDTAATTQDGISLLNEFLPVGLITGVTSTSNSGTNSAGFLTTNAPNPWVTLSGYPSSTHFIDINNFGVQLPMKGASTSALIIKSNGFQDFFAFMRTARPNGGALSINYNPNAISQGFVSKTVSNYSNGSVRVVYSFGVDNEVVFQSQPDGSVFFFNSNPSINPALDKLSSGTDGQLNFIGMLEAQKIYCIRASTAVAQGTVYNAAGGVAPNCSVMAFNRVSGRRVGVTKSNLDGSYSMLCTSNKGDQLFIVCLDDDGITPDFDAQIIDRVLV